MDQTIFADLKIRTHLLFRHTDDYFYNSDLTKANMREQIYRSLKSLGYERILFYSNSRKIYFFDHESKRMTIDLLHSMPKRKQGTSSLGGGLFRGSLLQAKSEDVEEISRDSTLNLSRMDDVLAMRRIDSVIKSDKIRTAVIFENGDDFMKLAELQTAHFVQTMANRLNEWKNLPTTNVNKVIFIFPPTIMRSRVNETYERNILWESYFYNLVLGEEKAIYETKNATLGETKNFLNRFRILEGLKVTMTDFYEITKALHAFKFAGGFTYRELEYELREVIRKDVTIDLDYCRAHFGYDKEKDVFGNLNRLVGLRALKDEVSRLEKVYERNRAMGVIVENFNFHARLSALETAERQNKYSLHYALIGNPGTGKSTTAIFMGQIFKALGYLPSGHVVSVRRDQLVGQFVGESAIKTQQQIEKAMGGVLFIDEAYSLHVPDSKNDYGQEVIDTLVANMSQYDGQFSVVIAGYKNEIMKMINESNPGFRRRFSRIIELEDYTEDELYEIYLKMAQDDLMRGDDEFNLAMQNYLRIITRFKKSNFGNAGEVKKLIKLIDQEWANNLGEIKEIDGVNYKILTKEELPPEVRTQLIDEDEDVLTLIEDAFKNIVGQEKIKELVRKMFSVRLFSNEQSAPGHYAFIGNPGTGKTTIARLLGRLFKLIKALPESDIVEITGNDLIGKEPGYTSALIKKSFGKIIFIDEAYSLVTSVSGLDVINELVKIMEDHRDQISLIFAGYKREMDDFIRSNSGLKSRLTLFDFADYSFEEVMTLLEIFMTERKVQGNARFHEATRTLFKTMHASGELKDGNARIIRKFVEEADTNRQHRVIRRYGTPTNAPEHELRLQRKDIPQEFNQYLIEGGNNGEN